MDKACSNCNSQRLELANRTVAKIMHVRMGDDMHNMIILSLLAI